MAKQKTEEKAVEATAGGGALAAIPEDLRAHHGAGTEGIGTEDVRPPRLLICQAGSPQRKPDDPKQIQGLNELDMFNDLSGEIYGRGPLKFSVVKFLGSRHVEFNSMEEGGGVKDFNVPAGDPRTEFTTDPETGKRVKPAATKFYDYLVLLHGSLDVLVLSLKSTQLKVATQLNGLLKLPLKLDGAMLADPPAWARSFSLTTKMDKDSARGYSWGSYSLKVEGVTDPAVREACATLHQAYSKKNVVVEYEREPGADDDEV